MVRMLLLTVVISALVWIVADQLDSGELTIEAVLVPDIPAGVPLSVVIEQPKDARVELRVRGANAALSSLRASELGEQLVIRWPVDDTITPGQHTEKIMEIASNAQPLRAFRVMDVRPETFDAVVDRFVIKDVPLAVRTGLFRIAGEARLEPPTAQVRMLQREWDEIQNPIIELDIAEQLDGQPEGQLLTFEVPIPARLAGRPADVKPKSTTVSLTLTRRNSEKTLAPVAVKFALSPALSGRYRIELHDTGSATMQVTVVGPTERVAPLDAQDIYGVVEVKREDASAAGPDGYVSKSPEFLQIPEGVRIQGERPRIEFRLVEIAP